MTNPIQLITDPASGAAYAAAAEVVLKATAILVTAMLMVAVVKRASAAARHLVWCLSLAAIVALPLLVATLPAVDVVVPGVGVVLPAPTADLAVERSLPPVIELDEPLDDLYPYASADGLLAAADLESVPAPASAVVAAAVGPVRAAPTPTPEPFVTLSTGQVVVGLWLLGGLFLLSRLLVGQVRVRGVVARAERLGIVPEVDALRRILGLRRDVDLVVSDEIQVPMTVGSRRPVILLPRSFAEWSEERRRVVLLHELAHVRRRDCVSQTLAQVAVALYWFHPLAWRAEAHLRAEAERAADDLVIGAGTTASTYADHLLGIVRGLSGRDRRLAAVSMAGSLFEGRLRAILARDRTRTPLTAPVLAVALLSVVTGVSLLAAVEVTAAPAATDAVVRPLLPVMPAAPVLLAQARGHDHDHDHAESHDDAESHDHAGSHDHADSRDAGSEAYSRAYSHHNQGEYAEAIAAFEAAIAGDFRRGTAMYNIACGHARLGHSDEAIAWLERALDAGFESDGLLARDQDLVSLRSDPRFQALRAAEREAMHDRQRRGRKARVEPDATLAEVAELEATPTTSGKAWYAVGMQLHRLGEYDRAVKAWRKAVALGHDADGSTYNIACALARGGDVAAAMDALEQAIELGWSDVRHAERDDDLDALREHPRFAELRELVEVYQLPPTGWRGSDSDWFWRAGWNEARGRYEELTRRRPGSGRAWFNLGWAQLLTSSASTAAESFAEAHRLGHRPQTSAYNTACARAIAGQPDAAMTWLEQALSDGWYDVGHMTSDDDLESLRDDPRFARLAERMAAERAAAKQAAKKAAKKAKSEAKARARAAKVERRARAEAERESRRMERERERLERRKRELLREQREIDEQLAKELESESQPL